ncbi:MAG: DUF433 domain-containing protein [Spirochaetia bacterium]|nr:DUF433 domain-containing protein [Spirochaetia bacterium]
MSQIQDTPKHAYIVENTEICEGEPVINGTRITVRSIVQYILYQGLTPEELIRELTQLKLSEVYDALSYYYDNKNIIDDYIKKNQRPKN